MIYILYLCSILFCLPIVIYCFYLEQKKKYKKSEYDIDIIIITCIFACMPIFNFIIFGMVYFELCLEYFLAWLNNNK